VGEGHSERSDPLGRVKRYWRRGESVKAAMCVALRRRRIGDVSRVPVAKERQRRG
jgi:hypothetical protein